MSRRPNVAISPAMRAYSALFVEMLRAHSDIEKSALAEQMDAALGLVFAERSLPWFPQVFDRIGK